MLAEQFGLRLLEPAIDWLPTLPAEYRKRDILLTTFRDAKNLVQPRFVKPPNDKSFPARVYTGLELPEGYDEDSPVLIAEVVSWEKEFRCFILDHAIHATSVYLRNGVLQRENEFVASEEEVEEAESLIQSIINDKRIELPRATVIDVGVIAGRGWAVVEQNAAWGSGIYGCDPKSVLEVIRHAALPDLDC